jgi:hypothetical protein
MCGVRAFRCEISRGARLNVRGVPAPAELRSGDGSETRPHTFTRWFTI